MKKKDTILVIGAAGQIGTDLVLALRKKHGTENVIAADINIPSKQITENGLFVQLDVLDKTKVENTVKTHKVTQVYLLAALLSATAEKKPDFAWKLNMVSLFTILNLAKNKLIEKVFWPSSIAVFGPNAPKQNCNQYAVTDPQTVYGISKLAGERWCEYYNKNYNVDVRSLRYPGLISYKSDPGGGTTDYAVHIYHEALKNKHYDCYLSENTALPMMYMEDAINATLQIMDTDSKNIKIRSSYNLSGISFTPKQVFESIKLHIPNFTINYKPDERQKIADSWPASINDSNAREDWGWNEAFDLKKMSSEMLKRLK